MSVTRTRSTRTSPQPGRSQDTTPKITVQRGDTLTALAREHHVSLEALIAANPQVSNPNLIHPGQQLNLPASTPSSAPAAALPAATPARAPRRAVRPDAQGNYPRGGAAKARPTGGVDPGVLAGQLPAQAQTAPAAAAQTTPTAQTAGQLSPTDRIIDYTARTEGGGRYDAWNANDNGHGVSFGLIQFNQKSGSLPSVMRAMHNANPQRFDEIMGPHAQNMLNESWVRSANLNDPDIKSRMLTAARDPQFQQVQRDQARTGYYEPAAQMARDHGLTSERAHAMLFDSAVQNGVGGTRGMLNRAAAAGGTEQEILQRFAREADANRYSGNRRTRILNDPNLSDGPPGSGPSAPTTPTLGTPPPAAGSNQHVVRPGESLSSIAAQHGTTWQTLAELNHISNPNVIHPNQVLNLPGAASPTAPAPTTPAPAAAQTYSVRSGDTLSSIAAQHGTTWQTLAELNHLSNPNLIHAGQVLTLPAGSADSPTQPSSPTHMDAPSLPGGTYDGSTPAPGTTSTRAWVPSQPPLTNQAGNRDPNTYAQVLNQFAVGNNPRYARRDGNTYCNIFSWDATRAMGAEIPHWVDPSGASTGVGQGRELDANGTNQWLHTHGADHGWRQVTAEQAQHLANQGQPAVASWRNPSGIGHIAMVRPGELTQGGPATAQAGSHNFNSGHAVDGFGNRVPEYWVHD